MRQIKATAIGAAINPYQEKIATFELVMPRFILAELNTHRDFSRSSASSRAISFDKMLQDVMTDPFIPIAWQKDHPGMQGSEYLDADSVILMDEFWETFNYWFVKNSKISEEVRDRLKTLWFASFEPGTTHSIKTMWLKARDTCALSAVLLNAMGVTKQICNRLLEPFMWHTVLLTATELENFFKLRCPKYAVDETTYYRSWKDLLTYLEAREAEPDEIVLDGYREADTLMRLKHNSGTAEIHMMSLAEAMWDAYTAAEFEVLKAGEWYIPGIRVTEDDFKLYIGEGGIGHKELCEQLNVAEPDAVDTFATLYETHDWLEEHKLWVDRTLLKNCDLDFINFKLKLATATHARISFLNHLAKQYVYKTILADITLHDRLASSGHWSAFEHSAQVPEDWEYVTSIRGDVDTLADGTITGWFGNFKGFKQYRKFFNNEDGKA